MRKFHFLLFGLLLCLQLLAQQRHQLRGFISSPIDTNQADEGRSYIVAIPSTYSDSIPSPLIISLHPYFESLMQYRNSLSMDSIAEANNVIMVYPHGDTCRWNYKPLFFLPDSGIGWNAGIIGGDFDDVAFVNRVVDSVITLFNIDTNRIFCMGVSNGGYMNMKLAAAGAHRFKAMASVIGFDSLSPTSTVPMLSILATKDTISRFNGTSGVYPAWSTIRTKWLNQNACKSSYASDTLPDLDPSDGSWVEKRSYDSCSSTGKFIEYLIWNGGHNVPNTGTCTAPQVVCDALGSINNDFDPSIEIWNFFMGNTITNLNEEISTERKLKVYPNPFSQKINFEIANPSANYHLTIYDLLGQKVYQHTARPVNGMISWEAKGLASGIYLYRVFDGKQLLSGKIQLITDH